MSHHERSLHLNPDTQNHKGIGYHPGLGRSHSSWAHGIISKNSHSIVLSGSLYLSEPQFWWSVLITAATITEHSYLSKLLRGLHEWCILNLCKYTNTQQMLICVFSAPPFFPHLDAEWLLTVFQELKPPIKDQDFIVIKITKECAPIPTHPLGLVN